MQHDLSLENASSSYILLSIGRLVAQIPSLLLAIAIAIIVTRVSSTQDMALHIGEQVSIFRAWIPVSAVLLFIGFVPGMPNFLFLTAAVVFGIGAWYINKNKSNKIYDENGNILSGNSKSDETGEEENLIK